MIDLTDRELEVLHLMADGLPRHAIARRLYMSVGTVRAHKYALFGKLGVHTSAEALAIAYRRGLLSPDPDIVQAAAVLRAVPPGWRLALVPWDGDGS